MNDDLKIEFFKSAREELMHRIKHRDKLLILHLTVQITFLCLANGVEIFGMHPISDLEIINWLFIPTSLLLCWLYCIENTLVGKLSNYCERFRSSKKFPSWDGSSEFEKYKNDHIGLWKWRFGSEVVVFFLLPILLPWINICSKSCIWFCELPNWKGLESTNIWYILQLVFFVVIGCLIFSTQKERENKNNCQT